MDPNSGKLYDVVSAEEFARRLREAENAQVMPQRLMVTSNGAQRAGLVQVRRDLTVRERAEMQIRLYSPCACGSGKKLKFCCYRKPKARKQ